MDKDKLIIIFLFLVFVGALDFYLYPWLLEKLTLTLAVIFIVVLSVIEIWAFLKIAFK